MAHGIDLMMRLGDESMAPDIEQFLSNSGRGRLENIVMVMMRIPLLSDLHWVIIGWLKVRDVIENANSEWD